MNTPLNKAFFNPAANVTYMYFNSMTNSTQSVRITWLLKGAKPPKQTKPPALLSENSEDIVNEEVFYVS
jgi:hypothetical protein